MMTTQRKYLLENIEVFNDVVVGREPEGEILGLGACNNGRTCKFRYPCESAVTVS